MSNSAFFIKNKGLTVKEREGLMGEFRRRYKEKQVHEFAYWYWNNKDGSDIRRLSSTIYAAKILEAVIELKNVKWDINALKGKL